MCVCAMCVSVRMCGMYVCAAPWEVNAARTKEQCVCVCVVNKTQRVTRRRSGSVPADGAAQASGVSSRSSSGGGAVMPHTDEEKVCVCVCVHFCMPT